MGQILKGKKVGFRLEFCRFLGFGGNILEWRKCPSFRCAEEHLEKYGIHLLALSHVYLVPHLKQICSKHLAQRLTTDNVVDVLQLARLCDAPDLYLKCMKLVSNHFKAMESTEGWKFLQDHDPWLELEILQFIDEAETVISLVHHIKFFEFSWTTKFMRFLHLVSSVSNVRCFYQFLYICCFVVWFW